MKNKLRIFNKQNIKKNHITSSLSEYLSEQQQYCLPQSK